MLQLLCMIPRSGLNGVPPRCWHVQMRSVEASLRLDAVASAGLRVSRAKAADLAKRGDLRCAAPPSMAHGAPSPVVLNSAELAKRSTLRCAAPRDKTCPRLLGLSVRQTSVGAGGPIGLQIGARSRVLVLLSKFKRVRLSAHNAENTTWDGSVNWRAAKGSALVKAGDMISASGMGRLEVTDVTPTKKGRWAVAMVRYV